jgi:hypothetical protein
MGQPFSAHQNWGDFYYAYSLKKSLTHLGWNVRVAFLDELEQPAECEIVLLGLDMHGYVPPPDTISIAWVISHPDKNTPEVLRRYRKAYVSSLPLSREWGLEFLAQAFDRDVHYVDPKQLAGDGVRPYGVVFVGNARNGERIELVRKLDEAVPEFHAWGNLDVGLRNWHGPLPWLRTGEIFRSSTIVIGQNNEPARCAGIGNDRMFAVIACQSFLLSDSVRGIEELFPDLVCYGSPDQAVELCKQFLADPRERQRIAQLCFERSQNESFDHRACVLDRALKELSRENLSTF